MECPQGAHAVKLTIEEAKSRGESFTEDEIKSAAEDLRALESMFVERIEVLAKSSATETSQQAGDLVSHARNALSSIQPILRRQSRRSNNIRSAL